MVECQAIPLSVVNIAFNLNQWLMFTYSDKMLTIFDSYSNELLLFFLRGTRSHFRDKRTLGNQEK